MGSKASKSCATENMKQIKELGIEEKTRTDILLFNTLKELKNWKREKAIKSISNCHQ